MKLLLTSAGLSNKSIIKGLEKLLEKPLKQVNLAFIPTAANVEPGDKSWMIEDLNNFQKASLSVDIVDISAISKDIWFPRLENAEILFFGGGNTFHLMHWVNKSGLQKELPSLLSTKVYAGISAGSCIAGPTVYNSVQNLFDEKYDLQIENGLGLVNFQIVPHLNSKYFPKVNKQNLEVAAKDLVEPVYAIDDNSAILVDGEKINVISEGEWFKFN